MLTIREAFAAAGHPVHEADCIHCRPGNDDWMSLWFTDFGGLGDLVMVFDEDGAPPEWVELDEADRVLRKFYDTRFDSAYITLNNLPAIDAIAALPSCVRKVVE